jgi:hypothetical protein
MYICKCGRKFEKQNSLNAHFSHCLIHRNGKIPINRFKGRENWNKGLKKETDERVQKYSKSLKDSLNSGKVIPSFFGKHHSNKTKEKLSLIQSTSHKGGYCKWIPYQKGDKIIYLQGSWEFKYAQYLDSLNLKWIKPGNGDLKYSFFWMDDLGIKRIYTPDFYIIDYNQYIEIKGYWRENDRIKMKKVLEQNKISLQILEKKDLKNLNLL